MNGKLTTIIAAATMLAVTGATLPASANSAGELLAAHNKYRQEVRVPPLTWSNNLQNDAQGWANYLASQGKFEHSKGRKNQGENLWSGNRRRFSYSEMVGSWGSEKRKFNNSPISLDNLNAVGHYTQMIWKDTKQVGCATANGRNGTVLVCRYTPAGNFLGRRPY
jgi:Cysteine-rich secretory protein family